jgi:hypothetical protein
MISAIATRPADRLNSRNRALALNLSLKATFL